MKLYCEECGEYKDFENEHEKGLMCMGCANTPAIHINEETNRTNKLALQRVWGGSPDSVKGEAVKD